MCKDINNVILRAANDDTEARYISSQLEGDKLNIGVFGEGWHFKENGFDEVFYEQLGMNISESFNWEA